VLLALLVAAFAPDGPLVFGVDETLERRRGKRIAAKGLYRDAVRSSKEYFVKASGLRWACLMLLVPVPWAGRTWAGLTWSGQAWTGRTWAGQTWTGRTWASDTWD
jgi:hypothetical protein